MDIDSEYREKCTAMLVRHRPIIFHKCQIADMFDEIEKLYTGEFIYPNDLSICGVTAEQACLFLTVVEANSDSYLQAHTVPLYKGHLYTHEAVPIITTDRSLFSEESDNRVVDRGSFEVIPHEELTLVIGFKCVYENKKEEEK